MADAFSTRCVDTNDANTRVPRALLPGLAGGKGVFAEAMEEMCTRMYAHLASLQHDLGGISPHTVESC